jgi:hypothetical protein
MKIVVTWEEFVALAVLGFKTSNPGRVISESPKIKKDYGSYDGGIGDAYEVPTEVWFEVEG